MSHEIPTDCQERYSIGALGEQALRECRWHLREPQIAADAVQAHVNTLAKAPTEKRRVLAGRIRATAAFGVEEADFKSIIGFAQGRTPLGWLRSTVSHAPAAPLARDRPTSAIGWYSPVALEADGKA